MAPSQFTDRSSTCQHCGKPCLKSGKYCSQACFYSHRRNPDQADVAKRFWEKVHKGDAADACWVWVASTTRRGYGTIRIGGRQLAAHRLSWELHNGPISDGLFVCHRCDNPMCVRPDHLWLGSHTENMQDMVAKGRRVDGPSLNPEQRARGASHGCARLSNEDVVAMRALYDAGDASAKELAERFGLSLRHTFKIVRRQSWRHL